MPDDRVTPPAHNELGFAAREHRARLHALAAQAGTVDAQDLVQDAFLRTVEAAQRTEVTAPLTFLYRVLRNAVIDRVRLKARWAAIVQPQSGDIDTADWVHNPERVALATERLSRAVAAIDRMPARRREVFLLHRFEGLTYVDIARRLGVSGKAVEKHVALAMAQLAHDVDMADDSARIARAPIGTSCTPVGRGRGR
jgi:RNA polymerase sigma-70 factor (ECF subfamily)